MIKFAAICPHPPVIIPTIGRPSDFEKTAETIKTMKEIASIFAKKNIETIVIISPHGPVEYQQITLNTSPALLGNFEQFNDYETYLNFENDLDITSLLKQEGESQKISVRSIEKSFLDHGALVPLYYLIKNHVSKNGKKPKVVPIAYSYPDPKINFDFGKIIFNALKSQKKNIAVIASGDLSHRLNFDAPAGYAPEGAEFDKQLIQSLRSNNIKRILKINPALIERAGECGYLSVVMLLGIIASYNQSKLLKKARFKALSYEGPFGVGYLVGYYPV